MHLAGPSFNFWLVSSLLLPLSSLDPRFYPASKSWGTMTMRRALQATVNRRAVVGKQGNMVQRDNQQVFLCGRL